MRRPAGVERSNPSLRLTKLTLRVNQIFKECCQSIGGPSQSVESPASQLCEPCRPRCPLPACSIRAIHRLAGELVSIPDNREVLTVGPSLQVWFLAGRVLASTGNPQVEGIVFPIVRGLALALAHDFPLPYVAARKLYITRYAILRS